MNDEWMIGQSKSKSSGYVSVGLYTQPDNISVNGNALLQRSGIINSILKATKCHKCDINPTDCSLQQKTNRCLKHSASNNYEVHLTPVNAWHSRICGTIRVEFILSTDRTPFALRASIEPSSYHPLQNMVVGISY